MMPTVQVSLALTHFNRYHLLVECIDRVASDPRIGEIVIVDDASTDDSYRKLGALAQQVPKIRLHRNAQNVDCYRNKQIAVSLCFNPWVILFDSDNILPVSYLDILFALPEWNPSTAYLPDYAQPHFDYTAFGDVTVSRSNVAQWMKKKNFATALNTANYFFYRESWLNCWDPKVDPHTADSIYQNLNWLKMGNALAIVRGLRYFHRVHPGSHYKQNVHKTGDFAERVEKELKALK